MKKKRIIQLLLLACFIIFSALFINPPDTAINIQPRSSLLRIRKSEEKNTTRTDFVDENGTVTFAADVGYATKTVTKSDAGETEKYYDEQGQPVKKSSGYYGLYRGYDGEGHNVITTYLNSNQEPMNGISGYATVKRGYDDTGKAIAEYYFDTEGNPVCTPLYGYGKINEYNENGDIIRITYVDQAGNPMINGAGYASVTRSFYSTDDHQNGRVEYEYYYDTEGKPIALSLGQFGVHKEYDPDGQNSIITYLDHSGNPMATTEGYTTIKRTFFPNNYISTERYFDSNGKPYALSEGQYGIERDEQLKVWYLNANGGRQFNLKKLLYNCSSLVIVFAGAVTLLSIILGKRINTLLLIVYIGCVVYFTLLFREESTNHVNLQLFWSYRQVFKDDRILADILRNIWMFIPLGTILYNIYPHKTILLVPIILSVLIEAIQFITRTGLCEFDDVLNNSIGGAIGYWIGALGNQIIHLIKERTHNRKENPDTIYG